MIFGFLDEGFAISGEDTSHVRIAVARELIVDLGLRDFQARSVHVLPEHEFGLGGRILQHWQRNLLRQWLYGFGILLGDVSSIAVAHGCFHHCC